MPKSYLPFIALIALIISANGLFAGKSIDSLKTFQIPSVTVTSSRAIERISPVPFNELNSAEIRREASDKDLPYLLSSMPSIIISSQNGNGVGYTDLTMRGFDQRRIAVMINGVPQNDPEDHNVYWINFSDIFESLENVQVQRGAGMANYGAAAIAGSINLTTSTFANQQGIKIYTGNGFQSFGSNSTTPSNTSKFKFEYASGLIDEKYSFYAKLARINSFGYRDQSFAFLNSFFLSAVRFDKDLTTQINVYGGSQNDGLAYNGIPKSFTTDLKLRKSNFNYWEYDSTGKTLGYGANTRPQEVESFSSPHYEVLNDWQISKDVSLKSTLFFYSSEGYFDYDAGDTTNAHFQFNAKNGFDNPHSVANVIVRANVENRQIGWIPRLIFNHEGGIFTTGLEMRFHRSSHWGKVLSGDSLPLVVDPAFRIYSYNGERDILSAFAREQYYITQNTILNIEGQLVHHRYAINNEKSGNFYTEYLDMNDKTIGNGGDLFNINYLFFNPRVGLNYLIDDNQNIYGSLAYTSHEPRMANLYDAEFAFYGNTPIFKSDTNNAGQHRYDFNSPLIKPESMIDIELGWNYKSQNYLFAANVYLMQYANELVKSGQLDNFGNAIDGNAKSTRHIGLELQASGYIFNSESGALILKANTTLSSNKIIDYQFHTSSGEYVSLNGNQVAGFPSLMLNAALDYQYKGLDVLLNMKYVGEMRTDNFGDLLKTNSALFTHLYNDYSKEYYYDNTLDPYFVANLTANYKVKQFMGAKDVRFQLSVYNLFNRLYAAYGIGKDFFPAAERSIFLGVELGL